MALKTLPLPETNEFADVAADLLRDVQQARAIFRAVGLAAAGQDDGGPFSGETACKWSPALHRACEKLRRVRDVMEASVTPKGEWNWVTPLAMAEALDGALWQTVELKGGGASLKYGELTAVTDEISVCLEHLATDCAKAAERASPETVEA